jgi:flagellar assembly protein FliH
VLEQTRRREGYRAGYAQGFAEARVEAQRHAERLQGILAQARDALAGFEQQLADDVLDLAVDIARQVLRGELSARRDALLPAVREAVGALPERAANLKLSLNPSDVDVVRAHMGGELKHTGWQMIEDPLIEPGGCKVSSTSGEADATLETRWSRVIQSLSRTDAWHTD